MKVPYPLTDSLPPATAPVTRPWLTSVSDAPTPATGLQPLAWSAAFEPDCCTVAWAPSVAVVPLLASQTSLVLIEAAPAEPPNCMVTLSRTSVPRSSRAAPAPVSTMLPVEPPAPVIRAPSVRVTAAPAPDRASVPAYVTPSSTPVPDAKLSPLPAFSTVPFRIVPARPTGPSAPSAEPMPSVSVPPVLLAVPNISTCPAFKLMGPRLESRPAVKLPPSARVALLTDIVPLLPKPGIRYHPPPQRTRKLARSSSSLRHGTRTRYQRPCAQAG